ncbi:MAG: Rieske 2Fe-2S domain-containing protein [Rhizobiales bacterium]|nr:Rieske 2Fe-2S domain-containing protein [Hyphomicrobiales bacterium]
MTLLLADIYILDDPGAVSVIIGEGTNRHDYLVVRFEGEISVFENACPHQGTPLETLAGKFFNRDQTQLLCSTHGAEFEIETGFCTIGPCKGEKLRAAPFRLEGATLYLN